VFVFYGYIAWTQLSRWTRQWFNLLISV
jgi:hypothetical protein